MKKVTDTGRLIIMVYKFLGETMAKKSTTKKAATRIVRTREVWKTVHTQDVKYGCLSYFTLQQIIHDNVPPGTPLEDIRFCFDVETSYGYYDDDTAECSMSVSYKTIEEY